LDEYGQALHEAIAQSSKNKFLRGRNTSLNTRLHTVLTQNLLSVEGCQAIVLFTDGMDREAFSCAPNLSVRVNGEAVRVRARQSYRVPKNV
jgi:hypothetical protein